MIGELYLIHIEPAYRGHARHYLGWSKDAKRRFQEHLAGTDRSSPLLKAAMAAGCKIELVKVWAGTRTEERRLKVANASLRLCPHCGEETRAKNAARMRRRREQQRANVGAAA